MSQTPRISWESRRVPPFCPCNSNRTNIPAGLCSGPVYMRSRELLARASSSDSREGSLREIRARCAQEADLFPSHGIEDRRPSRCTLLIAPTAWKTFGEEIRRMGMKDRLNREGCGERGEDDLLLRLECGSRENAIFWLDAPCNV